MEIPSAKHGAERAVEKKESESGFKRTTERILSEDVSLHEKIQLVFGSDHGASFWHGFSGESGEIQLALAQQLIRCNLTEFLLPELQKLYSHKTCHIEKKILFNLVENEAINGLSHLARSIDLFKDYITPELVQSFITRGSYDVVGTVCSSPELLRTFPLRQEALEAILKRAKRDGYVYKIIAENLRTLFITHGHIEPNGLFPSDPYLKELFEARYSIPNDPYKPAGSKNAMPECVITALCQHVDLFGFPTSAEDVVRPFYFDFTAIGQFEPIFASGTLGEVEELLRNIDLCPGIQWYHINSLVNRSKEFEGLIYRFVLEFPRNNKFADLDIVRNLIDKDNKRLEEIYIKVGKFLPQDVQEILINSLSETADHEMLGRLFIDQSWPQWVADLVADQISVEHIRKIITVLIQEFVPGDVVACIEHMPALLRNYFLGQVLSQLFVIDDNQNKIGAETLDVILEHCPEQFENFLTTRIANFDAKYLGSLFERGIATNAVFNQLYLCVAMGEHGIAEVRMVCAHIPEIKSAFRDFFSSTFSLEERDYWIEKFGL